MSYYSAIGVFRGVRNISFRDAKELTKYINESNVSQNESFFIIPFFFPFFRHNIYRQVRVAGLVTTLVNVTGGPQGATNATEDGGTHTRNGATPKVRLITVDSFLLT